MFAFSDIEECPWYVLDADDKKTARLNLISHLLSMLPYEPPELTDIDLPQRQEREYTRPPMESQTFVPRRYVPD